MNEKQSYQEMIEMDQNTCNITYKPLKKRKKKTSSPEEIKNKVIEKVNSVVEPEQTEIQPEVAQTSEQDCTATIRPSKEKRKFQFKFTAVSVQIAIIGVLLATIFLTNALNANSGINTFFKSVFGGEQINTVDARTYSDFVPTLNYGDSALVLDEQGVITIAGVGSIYSAVNGKVKSIQYDEQTSKYTVEVSHSDTFTSVYTGLDYVYAEVGAEVFSNLPLGYTENSVDLCFYSADSVITDYTLIDDQIVWAV
ncbi:MAG: hypothetical protein J6R83_03595 [Clostridia bacterium]|nr:hypothetical protein [Clostridia bacterium]